MRAASLSVALVVILTGPLVAAEPPGAVEVRFTDGSLVRLTLKEEKLEITTAMGKKSVPLTDVRKVELSLRIPAELAKEIEAAVQGLGAVAFKDREKAGLTLLRHGAHACPALLAATESKDMEIRRRAQGLLDRLRELLPEDVFEARKQDVIHTRTGKISGKIEQLEWKADTRQFGEVKVKLADVCRVNAMDHRESQDKLVVQADPGDMSRFQNQVGQVFAFKVTGVAQGSVWGSDVYTSDSTVAMAAVHAGVIKVGQTGVVKVRMVLPPGNFSGSARNGVSTGAWGPYPSAYEFVK